MEDRLRGSNQERVSRGRLFSIVGVPCMEICHGDGGLGTFFVHGQDRDGKG